MTEETTHSDSLPSWYPADQPAEISDDAATEIIHTRFDTGSDTGTGADSVVVAIVEAVATLTNDTVTELPPLYETVDSEALTKLMTSSRRRDRHVEVSFMYNECQVTLSSGGDIVVVSSEQ